MKGDNKIYLFFVWKNISYYNYSKKKVKFMSYYNKIKNELIKNESYKKVIQKIITWVYNYNSDGI